MHIDSGITPALSGRLIPRPCWLPPCQTAYLERTMRRGRQATSDRSQCVLAAPAVLTAAPDSRCAACCVMQLHLVLVVGVEIDVVPRDLYCLVERVRLECVFHVVEGR